MEAITNDVPEKELIELKVVLNKILDADCNPLGFDAKTLYNFVAIRFEKTTSKVQQQALHWLQILSKLEILIPLSQLFTMFGDGVRIMKQGVHHEMMNKEKDLKDSKSGSKDKDIAQPPRRSSICNLSSLSTYSNDFNNLIFVIQHQLWKMIQEIRRLYLMTKLQPQSTQNSPLIPNIISLVAF